MFIHVGAGRIVACYQYRPCVIYFDMKCVKCKRRQSRCVYQSQSNCIWPHISAICNQNVGWRSFGCDKLLREKSCLCTLIPSIEKLLCSLASSHVSSIQASAVEHVLYVASGLPSCCCQMKTLHLQKLIGPSENSSKTLNEDIRNPLQTLAITPQMQRHSEQNQKKLLMR